MFDVLKLIGDQIDRVVKIEENQIYYLKPDDTSRYSRLVYNIRGLTRNGESIETIEKLVAKTLGDGSGIQRFGQYQLLVSAIETDHRRISCLLGSFSGSN